MGEDIATYFAFGIPELEDMMHKGRTREFRPWAIDEVATRDRQQEQQQQQHELELLLLSVLVRLFLLSQVHISLLFVYLLAFCICSLRHLLMAVG